MTDKKNLPPDLSKDLKALGSGSTTYKHDRPAPELLERFPNPSALRGAAGRGGIQVRVTAPEVTSLCPLTKQPDFATIKVSYAPKEWCLESKSFKLYLGSFRQYGIFHEAMVDEIGNALVELLEPLALQVIGEFTPRGGIAFHPTFIFVPKESVIKVL